MREMKLKELGIVLKDGNYSSRYPKASEFSNEGVCFISASDFTGRLFFPEKMKHIPNELHEKLQKGHLKENDVLIVVRGYGCGKIGLVPKEYENHNINAQIVLIRCDGKTVDGKYLYYLLSNRKYAERLKNLRTGSAQPQLPIHSLRNLEIDYLPAINTQLEIVQYLELLDKKIDNNIRINNSLTKLARLLFNQWKHKTCSKRKYLPLTEAAFVNPDAYSPKEDWEYVNYLNTSSITEGFINEVTYIDSREENLPVRARRKVKHNDIVFSIIRPNQRHYGIITNPPSNMLVSTGFAVIRNKKPHISSELLYLCLTEPDFLMNMQQIAEQSTQTVPAIKIKDLNKCQIPEPISMDAELMQSFSAMFNLISNNHKTNKKLSELRDALSSELISGNASIIDSCEIL